jgi:hypothetical protein
MYLFFLFITYSFSYKTFDLPLTKILIKNNQQTFGEYSKEFQTLFEEKYKENINILPIYDSYYDRRNNNIFIESRYDNRLIDIYEILKPNNLKIIKIPTKLLDCFYISEYNGGERLWCNISKKYKDILLEGIKNNKYDIIEQINVIKECEKYLKDNYIDYL